MLRKEIAGAIVCGALACIYLPLSLLQADTVVTMEFSIPSDPRGRHPSYRIEKGPVTEKELRTRFTAGQLGILEKLNRADLAHLPQLPALVVPERWDWEELDYSPLPRRYDWARAHRKALVVYLPGQVFGAYQSGRLLRWGPISSGTAENHTFGGLFFLNWKSPGRHSTIDPEWYMRWYYNFDNHEGRAFHAYALPGYPASHSCIRLLTRDARWLQEWGDPWELDPRGWEVLVPGTPVLIVGHYAFDQPPPWRSLEWLAEGISLPNLPPLS